MHKLTYKTLCQELKEPRIVLPMRVVEYHPTRHKDTYKTGYVFDVKTGEVFNRRKHELSEDSIVVNNYQIRSYVKKRGEQSGIAKVFLQCQYIPSYDIIAIAFWQFHSWNEYLSKK